MTANLMMLDVPAPAPASTLPRPIVAPGSRATQGDPRWPRIVDALAALRGRRRHAVRIVDADCGCGTLLIEAARHARALGFGAIEVRGIDGSPALIGRAKAAAARLHDPAIGISFELDDVMTALASEADFPADIVLWHGTRAGDRRHGVADALAATADLVIGDPVVATARRRAA